MTYWKEIQSKIDYSKPSDHDRIKVENKQIPISIFEEARGRGWGRMQNIFTAALDAFKKMFQHNYIRGYIIKHKIYQGALTSQQYIEDNN